MLGGGRERRARRSQRACGSALALSRESACQLLCWGLALPRLPGFAAVRLCQLGGWQSTDRREPPNRAASVCELTAGTTVEPKQ